jgi:hypothetical protein
MKPPVAQRSDREKFRDSVPVAAVVPDAAMQYVQPSAIRGNKMSECPAYTSVSTIRLSDTENLPTPAKALFVNQHGALSVVTPDGSVRHYDVRPNTYLDGPVVRVNKTGTTITEVFALR